MAIPGKNADLKRRFKFYGFGLVLGIVLVAGVLNKNKGCQLPSSAKLDEISSQTLIYCNNGSCGVTEREIVEVVGVWKKGTRQVVGTGKINYDNSDPRAEHHPCPTYEIKGLTSSGKNLLLIIADCDTISKVVTAIDLKNAVDTCECK